MFVVVVYVSRIAVGLLLYRLTGQRSKRSYALVIIATSAAFGLASALTVAIRGDTKRPRLHIGDDAKEMVSEPCETAMCLLTGSLQKHRWIAYAVMSNALDVLISVAPISMVHDLHMRTSKKAKVIFCFALRLV